MTDEDPPAQKPGWLIPYEEDVRKKARAEAFGEAAEFVSKWVSLEKGSPNKQGLILAIVFELNEKAEAEGKGHE